MTALQPDSRQKVREKIGLIAGAGSVPLEIAEAIVATGGAVHVVALRNIANADYGAIPHTVVGLGQVGGLLRTLRSEGCTQVMMSGGLERPDLLSLVPDLGFFLNFGTILGLMRGGDDSTLRKILAFFERKGFRPVGIPDVAPALLAGEGIIAGQSNSRDFSRDTTLAFELIENLAGFDIGQAVVIRDGEVIGVEAAEGTDGLLRRMSREMAQGGILVKATKPNQDLRVDLPTIGPRTIAAAAASQLDAIIVEADRSVIAERLVTIDQADAAGICLLGYRRHLLDGSLRAIPNIRRSEDVQLAGDVLSTIQAFCPVAAVCVGRLRVLSIALGAEVPAIVENTRHVRQWGDQSGRHRHAVLAFSHSEHLSAALFKSAADIGVRRIIVLESLDASDGQNLTDAAAAFGIELLGRG